MNFSLAAPMIVRPNFDRERLVVTPDPEFSLYECEAGRRFSSGCSRDLDGSICDASGCAADGHTIRLVATTTDRARASRWFWFPGVPKVTP